MADRHLRDRIIRTHPYRTRGAGRTRTPGENAAAPGHTRIAPLHEIVRQARFETMLAQTATTIMPDHTNVATSGGWVQYGGVIDGQRDGVTAVVTPSMLRTGTHATYDLPFIRRRTGLIIVRGHLLARVLGGSGSNPRNLVPLYHARNNLPMYRHFEHLVKRRVQQGKAVRVAVTPHYPATTRAMSAFPDYITYAASEVATGANVLTRSSIRFYTGFHGRL